MTPNGKNGSSVLPVPVPPAAAPVPEPTLGELYWSAESAVRARDNNRRESDRLILKNPMDGFMHQAYAAVFTSGDPWADVPAAQAIKAYTNREFALDLVPEALRRVRGRVCEVLDIDAAAADALPLSRVVQVLRQSAPGTPEQTGPRWLRVSEAARVLAMTPGRVSRLASEGKLATNGKTRVDRRIDAVSVSAFELKRLTKQDRRDAH